MDKKEERQELKHIYREMEKDGILGTKSGILYVILFSPPYFVSALIGQEYLSLAIATISAVLSVSVIARYRIFRLTEVERKRAFPFRKYGIPAIAASVALTSFLFYAGIGLAIATLPMAFTWQVIIYVLFFRVSVVAYPRLKAAYGVTPWELLAIVFSDRHHVLTEAHLKTRKDEDRFVFKPNQ